MIQGSIKWATEAILGDLLGQGEVENFCGVSTDTRDLKPRELFFCLLGIGDGHQFAPQAIQRGAAAIILDKKHLPKMKSLSERIPLIVVEDTTIALGNLAHRWRKKFSIPILALTGSNGKTTTKDLICAILSTRYKVLATKGNLNNLIGVPKTLFQLSPDDEIAIIEMGMNDYGEIARLTEITEPTAGLITNIAYAHLEKLGGLEGVAQAKGELFAGLSPEATALVNLNDPRVAALPTPAMKKNFGNTESEIWGEVISNDFKNGCPLHMRVEVCGEKVDLALKLLGKHNRDNILAALAVGHHFGIPLAEQKKVLERFPPSPSRMELIKLNHGRWLIDDSYNANPSSTKEALKTLAETKGKESAIAILGDMLELGNFTQEGHYRVGKEVAQKKIEYLLAIGANSKEILRGAEDGGMSPKKFKSYDNVDVAQEGLKEISEEVVWFLVKGSRGNHLEKIVSKLKELF